MFAPFPRIAGLVVTIYGLAVLPSCNSEAPTPEQTYLSAKIRQFELTPRQIWAAAIRDFDGDGDDDVLIEGHGQRHKDRIFYFDGEQYVPGEFQFPYTKDRHACDGADIDLDGDMDVYCSAGADRGNGENNNQLFLGQGTTGGYKRMLEPHGAEDPFGRGRLVTFLSADEDPYPDLLVSVWGDRADDKKNETTLFRNTAGRFEAVSTTITGTMGGRCLAVVPSTDGSEIDDIVLCHPHHGASYFKNLGAFELERYELGLKNKWWTAFAPIRLPTHDHSLLAGIVLDGPIASLQIIDPEVLVSGQTKPLLKRRLQLPDDQRGRDCLPKAMAIADVNEDGHPDVFVTRIEREDRARFCAKDGDLLLLGPDYKEGLQIEPVAGGFGAQVYGANNHFIRLSGGERWEGGVEVIRFMETSDSER